MGRLVEEVEGSGLEGRLEVGGGTTFEDGLLGKVVKSRSRPRKYARCRVAYRSAVMSPQANTRDTAEGRRDR